MNYLAQELIIIGNSLKNDHQLKDFAHEYFYTVESFENRKQIQAHKWVMGDVEMIKRAVEKGLKHWGDGYPQEKKRQQKKLKDINEFMTYLI